MNCPPPMEHKPIERIPNERPAMTPKTQQGEAPDKKRAFEKWLTRGGFFLSDFQREWSAWSAAWDAAISAPSPSPAVRTESRVAEIMALARECGDIERRHCIGKAQGFDVRDAYARLESALREPVEMSDEEIGVMRFARFGAELFKRHRNDGYPGDVDGGELQELAEKFGLIEQREVTEPCGDVCTCAEIGDFPSVCYFTTAEAKEARAIIAAAGGRK